MFSICMFLPRLGRDRYLRSCCLLNSALSRGIADGEVSAMASGAGISRRTTSAEELRAVCVDTVAPTRQ